MNKAAAGTTTRITASSVFGTTTTPIRATTILAFVWLYPRIDILVNSWTRVFAWQKHRYCVEPPSSVAVLRAHTNGVNRP